MSPLFIELYLDEDVDVLVASLLRGRGFQAATAHEAGRLGRSDAEQLAFAASQGKALLTHNRVDYERLARQYFEVGREHCGILLAIRRLPHEIVHRLLRILDQVSADEMRNQIRYL
jgi:hypothetical protein